MKYSFVLPAYKATYLRESIDSILNQTYRDFELIIVNDASPEDLTSIVNSYHDERIQYYINEKNIGGSDLVSQWNYSITYAKGDYLILASDDDVYHHDYLEKMDVLVNKYPNVNVFRSRVQHMNADGFVRGESEVLEEFLSYIDFLFAMNQGRVCSGLAYHIFKREKLINIGGFVNFPSAWLSDDATVISLAKNGVVSHNEALFAFRTSELNISSRVNDSKLLLDKLIATESFFFWKIRELKRINAVVLEDKDKINIIISSHTKRTFLYLMASLVKASDKHAVLSCWSILCKVKSLNLLDRVLIYCKVHMEIVLSIIGVSKRC